MSVVKDMELAEYGRMKIEWVKDFMPALTAIKKRFEIEDSSVLYELPLFRAFWAVFIYK